MKSFFSCFLLQIIVLLLILQLHEETCFAATTNKSATCPPSHCGNITNIMYPFRLKGDPATCGDPEFELECVNNNSTLLLHLFPGKNYHVKAINYNNFTLRLVDPGVQEANNCSSIPRYSLSKLNFYLNNEGPYEYMRQYSLFDEDPYESSPLFQHVIYMNCSNPVKDDPLYVDTSPCIINWHEHDDSHVYAIVGDLTAGNLKPQCRQVKLVAPISSVSGYFNSSSHTFSYDEVHRMLVHGFEVSWMKRPCEDHCGKPEYCYLSENTETLQCDLTHNQCRTPLGFLARCGLLQVFGIMKYDKSFGISDSQPGLEIGRVTGKYVLSSYIIMRFMLGLIVFFGKLTHMYRTRHTSDYENIEDFLQENSLMPLRYSYKEIKKMTRGFKEKLGEGGYGSVYKGKLRSGPLVAVKMLSKPKANGQEFISEVATIGRIHHVNVVKLVGFCVESSKRALVYEFMPNGSLDRYISPKGDATSLTCCQMYSISLGVARGIAYLHQGCDVQILHFDIKPHNILLDENFIAKVSDFGLARLYPIDNNIITLTTARGTIGYMAPELFYKNIGGVSNKADVYSFGMLLMEMANRRRNLNPYADHSSQLFFPYWIYDQLIEEREIEMGEVTTEDKNKVKKMFLVAIWCIQMRPDDRPSMNKVIEMLEGDVESIIMPPKPSQYPDEIELNYDEFVSCDASSSICFLEETIEDPLLKDCS
ncbi:rust resistance kinase Lr10-like isoform X2 [Lotus japonicus]|uniref:rust resistance kinase Lr10-like isoform X2 n=1 Tax=Lotus japonicus TaxID=34305 RepID=UPI00258AFDBC|nr:rust resistance kinase Lr10-like isoform X2 [Lotus japonicus]